MNAAMGTARTEFAGPSNWSPQERLGAHLTGGPSLASRTADAMTVFYRGENNQLWHVPWSATAGFGVGRDMGGPPIASYPRHRIHAAPPHLHHIQLRRPRRKFIRNRIEVRGQRQCRIFPPVRALEFLPASQPSRVIRNSRPP